MKGKSITGRNLNFFIENCPIIVRSRAEFELFLMKTARFHLKKGVREAYVFFTKYSLNTIPATISVNPI